MLPNPPQSQLPNLQRAAKINTCRVYRMGMRRESSKKKIKKKKQALFSTGLFWGGEGGDIHFGGAPGRVGRAGKTLVPLLQLLVARAKAELHKKQLSHSSAFRTTPRRRCGVGRRQPGSTSYDTMPFFCTSVLPGDGDAPPRFEALIPHMVSVRQRNLRVVC